jgi:hypothetical protein
MSALVGARSAPSTARITATADLINTNKDGRGIGVTAVILHVGVLTLRDGLVALSDAGSTGRIVVRAGR